MTQPPFDWPVQVEIRVPWSDLDAAGHVNNANYFSYFETARVEAFFRLKKIDASTATFRDLDIILARTSCDFRSAASLNEILVVSVRPGAIGSSSFELRYEIHEKASGRLVAQGDSVQVMYDYEAQRKKPIPDGLREALQSAPASSK